MFTHIHSVTIPVADQDAALNFYVNLLGWEKLADNPTGDGGRWLTVAPPGAVTQLVLAPANGFRPDQPSNSGGTETGISLVAPDIDATYAQLQARGVTFKEPVMTMPWGTKATWFCDPDGNEFFLVDG